jgi:chromosome segregation ATPase
MSSSFQRLQEHLDAAGAEVAALRAQLAQKERQLDAAGAEVAALREEAAQQVASARQQSGDLQQKVRPSAYYCRGSTHTCWVASHTRKV